MPKLDVMTNAPKEQLFILIKSLTKAEKRNFKLYANRNQSKGEVKFLALFDVLDKMKDYDDLFIIQKMKGVGKSQLPNLKRHLYRQILISLRLIHIQKNIDIEIREQIDFARILYEKGLYLQSLKLLERIKPIAINNHQDILHLEILEFQKLIEERHITRSRQTAHKVEHLLNWATKRSTIINNTSKLSNLKIEMHGFYIQFGHVKDKVNAKLINDLFKARLANIRQEGLTFYEKIYLYQSHVWHNYILLDFEQCEAYAQKWVDQFEASPELISEQPDLFLRGNHYLLTSLFNLSKRRAFQNTLDKYQTFIDTNYDNWNIISQMMAFLYLTSARLNRPFMDGWFKEEIQLVPHIENQIEYFAARLDVHRILVFYYKIAYLYFGNNNFSEALDFVNKIIDLKMGHLREDIQCYARILQLLCHFEQGNYNLLEYMLPSASRFLHKMKERNKVQRETIAFLKKILKSLPDEREELYKQFYTVLEKLAVDSFEKRAYLYLDILSWVKGKIEGQPFKRIIIKPL